MQYFLGLEDIYQGYRMTITGKTAAQLHAQWLKNPAYVREFDALEEEFSLASALIEARDRSGLTQKELPRR